MEKILNANKYYEELNDLIERDCGIAIVNNEPYRCDTLNCSSCDLENYCDGCATELLKWLLSEYKEKPTITSNEKKFLELIASDYKYVVKDKDEDGIYVHSEEPKEKSEVSWISHNKERWVDSDFLQGVKFPFIKWEDEKAWLISDLLKLEVKDE